MGETLTRRQDCAQNLGDCTNPMLRTGGCSGSQLASGAAAGARRGVARALDHMTSRSHNTPKASVQRASLLLLLLSADVFSTVLHIIKHVVVASASPAGAHISAYLEIYHLAKLLCIVILFIYILRSTRVTAFAVWVLVFSFMLLDDALLVHQTIGHYLAAHAGLRWGIPALPPRVYELAVLALAGVPLSIVLAFTYLRSTDLFRKTSRAMLLLLLALVFFGLIVDAASVLSPGPAIRLALDIIEDAGEMVVFSLIIWWVSLLAVRTGRSHAVQKHREHYATS